LKDDFKKRLFIGIPAGREIQPILSDIQSSLAHNLRQIRWLPTKNIHMTLFFLDDIKKLTKALEDALNLDHFRASIFKTGVFPSARNPKIFWLGVSRGTKKLITLHDKVKKTALPFKKGGQKEYFIPHITLGRAKRSYMKIDVLPFLKYVYSPIEFDVNSVALYESQLLSHGAEYKVLTTFPLN
jgi:2'-5' RNA ligase